MCSVCVICFLENGERNEGGIDEIGEASTGKITFALSSGFGLLDLFKC